MRRKTRVKWKKENDKLISEPISAGTLVVYAVINPTSLSYLIKDVNGHNVYSAGNEPTIRKLKAIVKKEFIRLGAVFGDEIRNRIG